MAAVGDVIEPGKYLRLYTPNRRPVRAIRSQNAALRPCSVTTTGRCSWFQGERLREDRIPVPRTRRRCGATSAVGFG
ncbi:Uncharacterised protein [Mycobacteroides abscessus subsp. abscessus]|nr:Uncharacterised protein [Mycobacteroides abscessus subsp. abscessus]